jgi:alpha,alpha-trehalase
LKKSLPYRLKRMKKEIRGSSWKLVYNNFRPAKEALREALCTLGNGYFGTRGAAPESPASRIHYPGTYIAGVYNKLPTHIAGKTLTDESLVNCPNWLYLTFKVEDGDWIIPPECKILFYNQTLNMHNGVLRREIRIQTDRGYIFTIETRRIVHMSDPHLAAISYVITPENYEGRITVRSGLDGTVQNTGVPRYKQLNYRHLAPHSLGQVDKNTVHLSVKTNHSGIIISEVSKTRLFPSIHRKTKASAIPALPQSSRRRSLIGSIQCLNRTERSGQASGKDST